MLAELADLIAPRTCGGCGRPGTRWCGECEQQLYGHPIAPRLRGAVTIPVWTAGRYGGAVQRAINAFKEQGRTDLDAPLGRGLAQLIWDLIAAGELPDPLDSTRLVLVPCPSSPASVRRRGFDHMTAIARCAAEILAGQQQARAVDVIQLLHMRRGVRDSAGLSAAERATNLSGTLQVRPGRSWRAAVETAPDAAQVYVIVDDIVTTGATVSAVADALGAAGLAPHCALALRAA